MDDLALRPGFVPHEAGSVPLAPGEVHVWAVPLTGDPDRLMRLLSPLEVQRAERHRFLDHRRRFAIGHGALRALLGGYTGHDPGRLAFTSGPRGKPYLESPADLYFNLSHSGQLALVAVGRSELGVDLEKVRHLESLLEIARRHFSPTEFAVLETASETTRLELFYRCWTRKEAYIKAVGEGLGMSLDSFDVSLDDTPRLLTFRDGASKPGDWELLDVTPCAGYVAAVAVRGRSHRLQTFSLLGC